MLYLPPPGVVLGGQSLLDILEQQAITTASLPPSVLASLPPAELPALRMLCASAESCPEAVAARWPAGRSFFNAYGPTETTVCAAMMPLTPPCGSPVPIGRPIANTQLYILDAHLQPAPVGVPGELHIGGVGLARGYLNRPELTAERFIPNPFEGGARLYKTGDLARYRPDGAIEFLGRADHQVKLRGFRIELEEIEAALRHHPGVAEAVVVAREDQPGETRLVAYVVPRGGPAPPHHELRAHLKERLPEYMAPACFVSMTSLPRTRTGKVDRNALPPPDAAYSPEAEIPDRMQALTELWERVLGIQGVRPQDNFFDLGGHSLLVARVLDQIEKVYGKKIALATLLANPTLEGLENALREQETAPKSGIWQIQQGSDRPPLFFVHGDFFLGGYYCLELARELGADQPFFTFPQHGADGDRVPPTIEAMAAEHVATLRAFQPHGPYLLGGLCNGGLIAVEIARQLIALGEPVGMVAVIAAAPRNGRLVGFDYQAGRADITEAYRKAMIAYTPQSLPVCLTILWPDEEPRPAEEPDDPAMGWSRVAAEVIVHRIPGNHSTSLTDYVRDAAARLRACISQAAWAPAPVGEP